jgi:predicted  nucleic acid-binding Zn-ribbon protein
MTSIAELYAFQEIDLELTSCKTELEDVQSRLGETEELIEAKGKVTECGERLAEAEHTFRDREADADDLRTKIEPVEAKLYKGTVQNPKELADLQLDLDSLRRRRSDLEDRALEAMDELDAAQKNLAGVQDELAEVEKAFGSDPSELVDRQSELETQISELEVRRAEEIETLDSSLLDLYNQLVPNKQGRAVAKVERGACGGCRISLPTNVLQRARSGATLVRCSNCERILF